MDDTEKRGESKAYVVNPKSRTHERAVLSKNVVRAFSGIDLLVERENGK